MRLIPLIVLLCTAVPIAAQDTPEWARHGTDKATIRLFVRGDDFGNSRSSNLALSAALDAGILGWVSVMVVGPWITETARILERHVGFRVEEDAAATVRNFRELLQTLEPGLYRVVTHPAAITPEARSMDSIVGEPEARKRQAVLAALQASDIQQVITERNIELISVRDLWDYSTCQLKQ